MTHLTISWNKKIKQKLQVRKYLMIVQNKPGVPVNQQAITCSESKQLSRCWFKFTRRRAGLALDLIASCKHSSLCIWVMTVRESETIYWRSHFYKLRPGSGAFLILFIKLRMAFESLCFSQNGVKLWKGEFILAQILVILV